MRFNLAITMATIPVLAYSLDQATCNGNVGRSNAYAVMGESANGCVACLNFEVANAFSPEIDISTDAPNVWMSQGCFSKTLDKFKLCGDAYGYKLGSGILFEGTHSPECSSEDIVRAAINVIAQAQSEYKVSADDLKLSVGPDKGSTQSLYNIIPA